MAAPGVTVWDELVREHGAKAVVSLKATQEEVDAETERQAGVIFPLVSDFIFRAKWGLDFGAGDGRFVPWLLPLCEWLTVYEPSEELRRAHVVGTDRPLGDELIGDRALLRPAFYDLVFCCAVLGDRDLDLEATAVQIVDLLRPGGSLVLIDCMEEPKPRQWWIRRPEAEYQRLFARYGVPLRVLGRDRQLDQPITIMGGRKAG